MVTDREARSHFTIDSDGSSYWVTCKLCGKVYKGWDYRQNALTRGYAHQYNYHNVQSKRTLWAVEIEMHRGA